MTTDVAPFDGATYDSAVDVAPADRASDQRTPRSADGVITGFVSRSLGEGRGHAAAYVGLLVFTIVAFFKPQLLFPPLAAIPNMALIIALVTLAVYVPEQLKLEGRLTARPRELNLLLLLCLAALLSMPLAQVRAEAWRAFNDMFLKAVVIFIVIINVVRTERRLKGLFFIALAVALVASVTTLNSYRTGERMVEGYRATGILGGTLEDPNDMSLFLVTVLPIAVALLLGARGWLTKIMYALCVVIMAGGIVVTFSRGGFLALFGVILFLAYKIGRRRPLLGATTGLALFAVLALAPGNYVGRLASIVHPSLDEAGSAQERSGLLAQSIKETIKNPIFGLGIGNFHLKTERDKPTHNAYTQVSSEMGIPALVIYLMFLVTPFIALRRMEHETYNVEGYARLHALAIGLQASLVGYMIGSFFLSVAFYWFVYYLVAYAVCLRRVYETGPGRIVGRFEMNSQAARGHQLTAEEG